MEILMLMIAKRGREKQVKFDKKHPKVIDTVELAVEREKQEILEIKNKLI